MEYLFMKNLLLFLSFLTITISMTNGIGWAETLSADQNQTTDPMLGRDLINIPGPEANPDTQRKSPDNGSIERRQQNPLDDGSTEQRQDNENEFEDELFQDPSNIGKTRSTTPQKTSLDKTQQKVRLDVNVEPGDGLARLSWQTAGYRKAPDAAELRYRILVGFTSEKPLKTIEVGTDRSYTLRDLKNHQTYFVQVVAYNREQAVTIRSKEVKLTPLPAEEQGSSLEKSFSRKSQTLQDKLDAEPFKRELRQFGYRFFKNSAQSAGTMDNFPVGENYILGPGDSISITLWGSLNVHQELMVDRNGEITIPRVGAVKVWGLSYEKAKDVIEKAVSRYFKNFEINVTLGKLRTIQVYVVGEVEMPGSYPVSSLATVVNALSAAGGPTRNGSLRLIKLTRKGSLTEEIDLYDMFLSGDRSKDVRLQNGDTIFVPVIGPVVAIAGEVKRPAIYETKGKQTLADVLQLAGGITASGYTGRIQVERFSGNSSRVVLDYESKNGQLDSVTSGSEIQDRDMVKVFAVQEAVRQVVSLKGNVARPGDYQFRKGMRVKDVITGFADLLPESHLDSAEVTRLALPDYHKEILTFNLGNALNGSETDNIPLQEQDSIKVFSRWEMQEKPTVIINGFVVNPGKYDFYPGMTIRDLVSASGSLKRNAQLDMAELSRVTVKNNVATALRVSIDLGKALNGDAAHNQVLQPDDVLIVRGIIGWSDSTDKFVRLKGEVKFPGVYSVDKGEKLSSVIARAGGYTDKAYLRGAKFTRRSVRDEQQKRMDEIIRTEEKNIAQKQASLAAVAASKEELDATKAALEGLSRNIERMKVLKAEGRVVIRLSPLDELKRSSYDLDMEGGDALEIPARSNVINVMGLVFNPSAYVYLPENSSVEYYLNKSGGATNEAETSEIYVIRADGTVFSRQQSSYGIKWSADAKKWSFGSFMSSFMEPGDSLVVPQKLEHTAWLRDIKDITTIISQIALTAGTVLIGLR
jgi:protein involved in polysaccharide export with SLBB domain